MGKKEEMAKDEPIKDRGDEAEETKGQSEEIIEEVDEAISVQLEEKDKKIAELTDRLLRLQADFMNYKNRIEKEKESIFSYATEDLINQILPILDNFERAIENAEADNGFQQGVMMIYEQLIEMLNANGLKEIECLGEDFDPNFHHAVFMEEKENTEEGTVLEVLQKGYMLKDKVIRPSMVKVAK